MLRNTVGGGRVSDFAEKSVTKIYGQRYEGVDRCRISRKKCYVKLQWPLSLISRLAGNPVAMVGGRRPRNSLEGVPAVHVARTWSRI